MPGPISQSYEGPGDRPPVPVSPAITCDQVRALVEQAGKRWAVVIAGDGPTTQFITWGKSAEDKVYASDLSEYLAQELCGGDPPLAVYESFHEKTEAARTKARWEHLQGEVASVLQALDDLARLWGDEGVFRRCRDRLRAALAAPAAPAAPEGGEA